MSAHFMIAANRKGVQIAMEEIRTEQKLDVLPDLSKAFERVQNTMQDSAAVRKFMNPASGLAIF